MPDNPKPPPTPHFSFFLTDLQPPSEPPRRSLRPANWSPPPPFNSSAAKPVSVNPSSPDSGFLRYFSSSSRNAHKKVAIASLTPSRLQWPTKHSTHPAVTPPTTSTSTRTQRCRPLVLTGPSASPRYWLQLCSIRQP